MATERATGQPAAPDRAANERAATERTAGERGAGERTTGERTTGERTTAEPAADEWASGERAPLSAAALSSPLTRPGSFWQNIAVTPLTGSTNADLLAQAAGGAPEGSVLVAEAQTAGRGRMGRAWLSPPGAGLMFSVLLRPGEVPPARRGWVPLLTGVAIASAVRDLTGLDARLKWPNDVLVGDRKLAGILAEQSADAIVVGAGINVSTRQAELPVETATSLVLEGAARTGREQLLCAVLGELERLYLAWSGRTAGAGESTGPGAASDGAASDGGASPGSASPGSASPGSASPGGASPGGASPGGASPGDPDASGLRDEYRRYCATLGRQVRVEFPGGESARGTAIDVDPEGRLLLRTPDGPLAVSAGDVVHIR